MFLVLFIAALGEELGWSGYVIDSMQDRWDALQAGILLRLAWALLHVVPLAKSTANAMIRPVTRASRLWIAWWCLHPVAAAARILIVRLYNNTGKSVFASAVPHH